MSRSARWPRWILHEDNLTLIWIFAFLTYVTSTVLSTSRSSRTDPLCRFKWIIYVFMARYAGHGWEMERISESGPKEEWQFSVGSHNTARYVLHHWVSGRRRFQSAGHRDPAGRHEWWNTCTHLLYPPLSTYTCIPPTPRTFTLRFWLIERSGALFWLHTFCVFKFTALFSTLSYTVDVFVFSIALRGDSEVGKVWRKSSRPPHQHPCRFRWAGLCFLNSESAHGTQGKRFVLFS